MSWTDASAHETDVQRLERLLRSKLAEKSAPIEPTGASTEAREARSDYRDHVNASLHRILSAVALDTVYVEGRGTVLVDDRGREVLDFAGAYGALPLGHNPEVVWRAVEGVRDTQEPSFVQLSVGAPAAALARELAEVAPPGLSAVTFANSGAEAVEAALKIARSATGRTAVLSTDRGFHGKTLGALSATGNPVYQAGFAAPVPGHATVPFGDADAMREEILGGLYAAVIVEPVQGEGGVNVAPEGYLEVIRQACDESGTIMIVDEVQTGLGRTGAMFASVAQGAVPDVITLAKALGGGMVPMGAVLARQEIVTEHFSLRHTSTFAGGALAARVASAVLGELRDPVLLQSVRARGRQLSEGLSAIARRHPGLITDVRGSGLLIGVELTADVRAVGHQSLVGSLAEGEGLSMLMASYLLEHHRVRVAPTLFGARVLRVEPPLTVSADECGAFLDAMEETVGRIARGDTAGLLAHLVGRDRGGEEVSPEDGHVWRKPARDEFRFAFIAHPLDADSVDDFDETLRQWSEGERLELLRRFADAGSVLSPSPFLVGSGEVESRTGVRAHGELIGVPYTADQLMSLPSEDAVGVIRQAIDLAAERGAQLVGLGAYSSIVTDNARALGDTAVPVTTGNTFTAAAAVNALRDAVRERGEDLGEKTLAVVGAGGSIGRVISLLLAGQVARIVLVGRPGGEASPRLVRTREAVEKLMAAHGAGTLVEVGTDVVAAAASADLVVTATSSPGTLLRASDLRPGMIVCDVAQPPNIAEDRGDGSSGAVLFDGGIVSLPEGRDFGLRHGLAPGVTYACMAETMVIALESAEGRFESGLLSAGEDLDLDNAVRLGEMAQLHGFALAGAHTWRK